MNDHSDEQDLSDDAFRDLQGVPRDGDQQGQGGVGAPQRLQARDDADFVHPEPRQQGRPQKGREPGDGEQDQKG